MAILAAIAIPNFVKFQCRSKQSEAKTNLKALYVAYQGYHSEYDLYPEILNPQPGGQTCAAVAPCVQK